MILHITSNTEFSCSSQKESEIVEANSMEISEAGCYKFLDKEKQIVASYPINFTIILKVTK